MNKDYVKVVYESKPIGKERIILKLTTFDLEKFKQDEMLNIVPEKREEILFEFDRYELNNPNFVNDMEVYLNSIIQNKYGKQIEDMKQQLEYLKSIKNVPVEYSLEKNAKNITNSDDVHCNIVYGNITNCDNIYCNEIKGNIVNCDKVIYRKGESNK